jgi:hypothetical protein
VLARDSKEFMEGIAAGLAESDLALAEERRRIAQNNTWAIRYQEIKETVLGERPSSKGEIEALEVT